MNKWNPKKIKELSDTKVIFNGDGADEVMGGHESKYMSIYVYSCKKVKRGFSLRHVPACSAQRPSDRDCRPPFRRAGRAYAPAVNPGSV